MRNGRSQFSAISMGFPPDSRRLSTISIAFLSFSISFGQLQSVLINFLGGHFGPKKKYLAPPPPNSPTRCRHPPGPSAPPPPGEPPPPPPGIFNKNRPAPLPTARTPLPPPRAEKKIKNIRNVHQVLISFNQFDSVKNAGIDCRLEGGEDNRQQMVSEPFLCSLCSGGNFAGHLSRYVMKATSLKLKSPP